MTVLEGAEAGLTAKFAVMRPLLGERQWRVYLGSEARALGHGGFVSAGTSRDTAAFAVNALRRWWRDEGAARYPGARRLLVTCDAGGSNSYTSRLWKHELAVLAAETGLQICVCHFPPGTSKRNKCAWPGGHPGVMKCLQGSPGAVAVSTLER